MEYLVQIFTAFLGSLGFSVVFKSKKKMLLVLGFGGALSWFVYLISKEFILNDPACYFIASVFTGVFSEVTARIMKTPVATILMPVAVPLIPGSSLYYTMRYAFSGEFSNFMLSLTKTLKIALAIALGIMVVSAVVKLIKAFTRKN